MCVGLLKEVEFLAKEKVELQCQAEKDYSSLRSQMRVLEVELEEQMNHNQELEKKLLEVTDLKQQIQVLEKQLKNQRQFMDVSKFKIQLLPRVLWSKFPRWAQTSTLLVLLKIKSVFGHVKLRVILVNSF